MKVRKETGSFYVRKNGSSTGSWSIYYQFYKDGKKQKPELVQKLAYPEFGFRLDMSLEEARARVKQLNAERKIDKDKIRKSAERVVELKLLDKTLFPPDAVNEFIELLEEENFGSEAHLKKTISRFNFIQKLAVELKLSSPAVYKESTKKIYKYFIKKKVSLNYSKTLISVLNRWGHFVSKRQGSYYEEVPVPKGRERSAIAEAQRTKVGKKSERGVRIKSDPLTPEILANMKDNVSEEHYNWLYLTVWLGLRPEEADSVKDENATKITYREEDKVYILSVYQSKLMSVPENERWKHIPLIFKEQKECLDIIKAKPIKRPHSKTVRKHSKSDKINLYGGRKNFVDLCLDRGQDFVDVSAWMGHTDTSITYEVYKQRQLVRYKPVEEKKKTKAFKIV